ncbi:hypothetical protein PMIN06_004865 [Paraphaeosphaeria minitans]|uniref:Uncharacterized protein n=1 Tax=Paraphaeosphaeria minitans TaxID=565426 RepID=A0A9P6KUE5_9PLEO|nr:hypothetical protein PMIN01_02487 [Paraphaeosphaeria minitans]
MGNLPPPLPREDGMLQAQSRRLVPFIAGIGKQAVQGQWRRCGAAGAAALLLAAALSYRRCKFPVVSSATVFDAPRSRSRSAMPAHISHMAMAAQPSTGPHWQQQRCHLSTR